MSKIYTKTGDDGTTALFDGTRVLKDNLRVDAYGDVDELNAFMGLVSTSVSDVDLKKVFFTVQNDLFALGAKLANPMDKKQKEKANFGEENFLFLEKIIDQYEKELNPLTSFILPGGSLPGAYCHLARTICRRAERKVVMLGKQEKINADLIIYLNRLSDLLFVLARVINKRLGAPDIPWKEQLS
ncbi:MAG: ATP:cob(I)alamin adenosyltransferase [Deltaproteobacteria bacterium RIFCSPLOWO2_12_FULL_40_28]|nr:MAG: ATP:cob(I)alamin adenosyltransferase [Deltaproteobacteria bacterium RIFCSPHIGHO2_02_FULL_40_28]OGQ19106.1 MAG: ATP:cob(I)alamin adenosyltransferase [Deltaproteobacteria bacterium RIFCSPHIGHO2_12_FULL_40_32]OGQ40278.1 MAG: ATP:cob(I)alamin adenosyltransferase [Deltaproteobacteria bacterium RIFCSPLOWO2_02_FULL_40_36]OGQ53549.1 MAG: ATP:cob(I)alamin adenosyltransferase [Deltaproteobacteria bacterium RIFCSPLOWO2_12_FULL_40_28]